MNIIDRIKELVQEEKYKSIRESNEYYVPEAINLYRNYKNYTIGNNDLEYLISTVKNANKGDERYREFLLKNCKNAVQKDFVELLSKLIAYIDTHASGKKVYNSSGRVIIGTTSIRQKQWLENFLQYKKNKKINSQNIINCIKYLENPEKQYPILDNKQIDKINEIFPGLLQTQWTICKNSLNNTYLIKEILYKCEEIRNLWDLYTIEKLQTQDIAAIAIYTLMLNNTNETEFIFDKLKNTEFVQKALEVKNKRNFQFPSVIRNSNKKNHKNPIFTINKKNNDDYYGLTNYGKEIYKNKFEQLQDYVINVDGDKIMSEKSDFKQPLNQILYGPPGTGKTYNSINYAVAAIENKKIAEVKKEPYTQVKQRYDNYKLNKQIEFITFHQSYSYEEFVEGIKPYIPWGKDNNSNQNLQYIGKDGIFKDICDKAKNIKKENTKQDYNFKNMSFYKLWLSDPGVYEYCKENNCISLSWAGEFDFTECTNTDMIKEKLPDDYQQKSAASSQLDIFKNWIDNDLEQGKDVIVIVPETWTTIRAIGKIVGNYEYSQDTKNISHKRQVEWLKTDINIPYDLIYSSKFMPPALSGLFTEKFNKENFINLINNKNTIKSENCVLIIDEINRGNISKIFGELITLIEEDKRENMTVTLPYSKDPFTVPKNLYIIGTMNTADRSIASVDIALRRRFKFIEMMPKPELLIDKNDNYEITVRNSKNDKTELYKINLQVLLKTLNERISYLLDPDHQIGHSYFLNLLKDENGNKKDYILESDLKDVFKYEILPLLNEYFYDDWDKLLSVLIDNDKDESNKQYIIDINNSFIKEGPALSLRCDYNTNSKRYSFRINDNDFNIRTAIECVGENIISPAEIRNVKTEEVEPNE